MEEFMVLVMGAIFLIGLSKVLIVVTKAIIGIATFVAKLLAYFIVPTAGILLFLYFLRMIE